jgi:ferrochelatase
LRARGERALMPTFDAVMLLAFGGPESMDEVRPFLRRVLEGRTIPEERFEAVVRHYEVIGGRSPLCDITRRQALALEAALARTGSPLPVVLGMRNSAPFIGDSLRELGERGAKRVLGLIMAAHESPASHGRYREAVARAQQQLGPSAPEVRFCAGFHLHPGFITANLEHLRAALLRLPEQERADAVLVFTAHSIPISVAQGSPYVAQLEQSAARVAAAFGRPEHLIAYQSRSGSPREPWLEPDVSVLIRAQAARGTRALLLCPIGFVCDHVEVLYDLDIEAAKTAREAGIALARAQAVNDAAPFIDALALRVREACSLPTSG